MAVPGTAELSEELWQQMAVLLATAARRLGRPSGDLRHQIEGMLAVIHTGEPCREVPGAACGPWQTIYARFALWVRTDVWERIAAILHSGVTALQPAAPH